MSTGFRRRKTLEFRDIVGCSISFYIYNGGFLTELSDENMFKAFSPFERFK